MIELKKNIAHFALLGFVTTLALPVLASEKPTVTVDKTSITQIKFELADEHLDQFGFPLPLQQILERVSKNLSEWHYPVSVSGLAYSHSLKATLGAIANQATPVGFSFTSGNSDPRASGFQKADVLPISCQLISTDGSTVFAEHHTTFSVHELSSDSSQNKRVDKLVDHLSTACFTLLDDLKLPVAADKKSESTSFKPGWMPEVRVEVREVPAKVDAHGVAPPDAVADEPKKEIIIHNQGTPMIFQFGHERR
ncbi:MAG: hypothetical protein HOO92_01050 [Methylococcaceae bacterium]|nr:hypothetical protein [Methylococcaceae bacterium]